MLVKNLLNILAHFSIIAPVNTNSITTGNTFINPVKFRKKRESPKIVLDDRHKNEVSDKKGEMSEAKLFSIELEDLFTQ